MKVPGVSEARIERKLAFSLEEYKSRIDRVRKRCRERGFDALLLHTPENILYLSGYQTAGYYYYQCMLVPPEGDPIILTRAIEETNAKARAWCGDSSTSFMDHEDPVQRTANLLKERKLDRGKIGIEETSWFLSIKNYNELKKQLPSARLEDCFGIVEAERMIKSQAEVDYIRSAALQAEAGMRGAISAVTAGASENDVAAAAYNETIRAGGEYPGHPHFISSGWRTSLSHSTWAGRVLQSGDPVFIEVSGCVNRYSAALLRMCCVGEPSEQFRKMADTSIKALETMIAAIRPGIPAREPWAAWAKALEDNGFQGGFKRTGYSIGVCFPPDWGEGQIINFNRSEERLLQENMVFHIPSMVKVFGVADFGTSETVRVTKSGAEAVTNFERRLFVRP